MREHVQKDCKDKDSEDFLLGALCVPQIYPQVKLEHHHGSPPAPHIFLSYCQLSSFILEVDKNVETMQGLYTKYLPNSPCIF